MIKLDKITEIEIKDGILTISQFDNNEVILTQDNLKKLLEAINYTYCCKSDSEQLFCSDCNIDLKKANGFCPKYIDCEELKTK